MSLDLEKIEQVEKEALLSLTKVTSNLERQALDLKKELLLHKKEISIYLKDIQRDIQAKVGLDKVEAIHHYTAIESRLSQIDNKIDGSIMKLQGELAQQHTKATSASWVLIIPSMMAAVTAISVAYFNRGDINANKATIEEQQGKIEVVEKQAREIIKNEQDKQSQQGGQNEQSE